MRTRLAFLLLYCIPCFQTHGQVIDARASVDSTEYLVGDWITVTAEIRHAKDQVFQAAVGDTLGGFHVISRSPVESINDTSSRATFILAKFDSGTAIVPPLTFVYQTPGDTGLASVSTNPLVLTIHTLRVDPEKDIRDIKPPLTMPWTVAEIALYLGIILAIAAAGYFIYRFWKRRRRVIEGEEYVAPTRPAHVIAYEELAILKEKRLWQQGLIKEYYSEVTEILRRYFENRFGIMALEQTTDEILGALAGFQAAVGNMNTTENLLRRADLVKFAKYAPGIPEHEEMMKLAYEIVNKTKVVEIAPEVPQERSMTYVES